MYMRNSPPKGAAMPVCRDAALRIGVPAATRVVDVKATASPVSGFVNPVTVSLKIGDVAGGAQVVASLR
jgi:hypothetical protein